MMQATARSSLRRWIPYRCFSATPAASASNSESSYQPTPMKLHPLTPQKTVPSHIHKPPYAATGVVPYSPLLTSIVLHDDPSSVQQMREAARVARALLDYACTLAHVGITTDEIDTLVHDRFVQDYETYPSPLNYAGFPKSICSSVNEIICHGIPDTRPLQLGDVVSFDVSCFHKGVHGDNCATIIVGDDDRDYGSTSSEQPPRDDDNNNGPPGVDWRGVPYRTHFADAATHDHFLRARRLVTASREALYAGIHACRPGGCLTAVGAAIHAVADDYGYGTVEKYRGHGICSEFHCPPFVKHFRNDERIPLRPGMIFTIEPMLTEHSAECTEWEDGWTVSTVDGGLAAQFEHTVYISEHGVEILTVSGDEDGMVSI